MENPRLVNQFLVGLVVLLGAVSVALSLYLWNASPLVAWILMMAGVALGFAIVTGILAVTVWPLVVLIAIAFDGRGRRRSATTRTAEPACSADRGRNDPGSRWMCSERPRRLSGTIASARRFSPRP